MKGLFILGLTGPSGAGKSEVARLLAEKGIPLVDADALVREVQKPGSPCLKALADVFSSAILRPDGSLDRGKLAELAFGSPEQTQRLNRIVHPAVIALSEERLRQAADAGCDTFLTGDVKYNQFRDAQYLGLNLIDAGHFWTENPVCDALAAQLRRAFPALRVMQSETHTDVTKFA